MQHIYYLMQNATIKCSYQHLKTCLAILQRAWINYLINDSKKP